MKQLTNLKACISCKDPCCRFHVTCRDEAPVFTNEEYLIAIEKMVPEKIFKKKGSKIWQLKLSKWEKGYLVCPLLFKKKYCKLKDKRPFDCKVWPFQVVKYKKKIYLGYDKGNHCPAVSKRSKKYVKEHTKDLGKYLESNSALFKKYPGLFVEFDENIELIGELDI